MPNQPPPPSKKRKADDDTTSTRSSPKRSKIELPPSPRHKSLPPAPNGTFSLFLREDFREHFCHCATCYPRLRAYPQLLEEEIVYEPPLSESGEEEAHREGGGSVGTGSLLDRGEAALSNVDRVKAIGQFYAFLSYCLTFLALILLFYHAPFTPNLPSPPPPHPLLSSS